MTLILLWLAFGALGAFTLMLCYFNDPYGLYIDDVRLCCWTLLSFLCVAPFGPLAFFWACEAAFKGEV